MEHNLKFRLTSILMVVCLLFTMMPVGVYALNVKDRENTLESKYDVDTEKEHIIEKDECTTTYSLGKGQKKKVFHGGIVRYKEENGELTDYDPSLVELSSDEKNKDNKSFLKYAFKNNKGDKKQYFPDRLVEDAPIIMENEENEIKITLAQSFLDTYSINNSKVKIEKEKIETLDGKRTLPVTAVYGSEKNVSIKYRSEDSGVKESIVFYEHPKSNIVEYKLNVGSLKLKKNEHDKGLTIFDSTGENIVAGISPAWMIDKKNAYSEDIYYEVYPVNEENGEYILKMVLSNEYLNSKERKYPVTVDPTITWLGSSQIRDVYVISGSYANTNFYSASTAVMPAGRNSTGTHETYLAFSNLKNSIANKNITSATLSAYEVSGSTNGQRVGIYISSNAWNPSTLTFNNRPSSIGAALSSIVTQPAAVEHKFDVTKYAQNVAKGAYDYGLILKNITSSPQYAVFFGSRTSATAYRPKLTIIYSDIPPLATSAEINPRYTSDSTKSVINFSGLSGPDILRAEYKINEVKEDTKEFIRTIYDFSDKARIFSGDGLPDIGEGTYEVFVRGVNKAGIIGPEKSCGYVYVDKTKPVIGSITLKDQKGNIIDKCTGDTNPKIEFADLKDLHIDKACIKYAIKPKGSPISDSDYKVPTELVFSGASNIYRGSFRLLQEDRNLPSSEYVISIRVTDFAQNIYEKRLIYTIDSENPKGAVKIKDLVSGNVVTEIFKPVNIEIFADGTGSPLKESTLKMYKLEKNEDGGFSIDKSTEVLIDRNFTISKNIIFDTLDICDSYGKYRFILSLKDSVGRTAEISQDFDVVYKLSAPKSIKISHSDGSGKATVTWKFPHNIQQKIRVSELEIKYNEKDGFKSLVKADKDKFLPFEGSAFVTVPKEEGEYSVVIRGKSQYGHAGSEKKCVCIVDKTKPTASLTHYQQGYILGSATDKNLKGWNIYVKNKGAENFDEKPIASGVNQVKDYFFALIDFGDKRFEKGENYIFKLVVEDESGNQSEDIMDVYVPLDEPIAKLIPPELEIEKSSRYVKNGKMIVGMLKDSFRLKGNVVGERWYINNVLSGPSIRVNIENKVCYKDAWNKILAMKINKDNSRSYSSYVVENGIKSEIKYTAEDLKDGAYEKYCVYLEDVLSFIVDADPSLADYYIKTSSKGKDVFTKVIPGEKYYVTELSQTSAVSKGFVIKAIPKPGKIIEGKSISVYSDSVVEEEFLITKAEDYAPLNLTAEDKLNYKTYLKWDIPESIPEDISYEVYRDKQADFVPNKENLIAKDIKAGYFTEMNIAHGETFYYKVCAVHKYKDITGSYELRSSFSETASCRVIDQNESLKRMGLGEQWEYAEFPMVQAEGYIEKSKGNFVYQRTDANLPNEGFDVCLKRTYNSQGSYNGIFGFGWSHDYDMELLNICENNSLAYTHVILKDGNGTIYHFTRNSSDETFISSLGDYVNLIADDTENVKKVNIKGFLGQRNVEIKYQFMLTTKGGDLYYFNAGGQLVYMENQNGKFVVFEHDKKKGVLTKMTTDNNLSIDFIYHDTESGNNPLVVKEIHLPDKSKVLYDYEYGPNSQILLTKVTEVSSDSQKITWTYEYDKPLFSSMPLNLVKVNDAKGKSTYKLEYDYENDSVKEAIYPNGEKFTFSYTKDYTSTITVKYTGEKAVLGEKDFFDRIYGKCEKSIRGASDIQKILTEDESGLDVRNYSYVDNKVVSTESTVEYQQIENDGFISDKKSVKKSSIDYRKDNPIKEKEDDGAISEYTYYTGDEGSYLEDMLKTIKEFDANGELSSYKKYGYDSFGNITEVIDYVEGTKVINTYYTEGAFKGELKSMKESLIRLDNSYNIIDESVKGISEYAYSYDAQGNLTKVCTQTVHNANGKSESITSSKVYDMLGRLLSDTDSRGYQSIYTYDGFGRVVNTLQKYDISDNLKDSVMMKYDENSNLIYEKASSGLEKWYTYDNMGLVTSTRVKKVRIMMRRFIHHIHMKIYKYIVERGQKVG